MCIIYRYIRQCGWLLKCTVMTRYPDLVHRVRIGSSTFTAIQESAKDGQTKGVSEIGCIFPTCINEVRFYEHVEARIISPIFPAHAIVLSTLTFSYYTTSKLVLRPSSHASWNLHSISARRLYAHTKQRRRSKSIDETSSSA